MSAVKYHIRTEVCNGEERLKSSSGEKRNDFVANPIIKTYTSSCEKTKIIW